MTHGGQFSEAARTISLSFDMAREDHSLRSQHVAAASASRRRLERTMNVQMFGESDALVCLGLYEVNNAWGRTAKAAFRALSMCHR